MPDKQYDDAGTMVGQVIAPEKSEQAPAIFTDAIQTGNPVTAANDGFLELTGFMRDQILGRPQTSVLADIADADTVVAITCAAQSAADAPLELSFHRTDGTRFRASVTLTHGHDEAGKVRQSALMFRPFAATNDRNLMQRSDFHALYQFAPGFIAMAEGADHRFSFANASYKKFVGRSDLEGRTVAEALPDIVEQGFIDILDTVYRTGVPYQGSCMAIDIKDHTTGRITRRYCDLIYQPVKNEHQQIIGLFCEGYDVTAQREAEQRLALVQAELIHLARVNAMGTMALTLAHELNQPLSAITNYVAGGLRLIGSDTSPPPPLARALHAIDDASQRASDIIRSLRDLTKRKESSNTTFRLKPAVEECIRLVSAATLPNVEIVDSTNASVTLVADRIQIQQVVINLLRNACDAVQTSEEKRVTVNAIWSDSGHTVSVSDTGPGVSLKAAENIFSWTDSTKEGGMGLGLSICRTIIEGHGGRIWLERSDSIGSEFCFTIP